MSLEDKETKQKLVVGTAHLFWNPEFTHGTALRVAQEHSHLLFPVKLAQSAFLIEQLTAFLTANRTLPLHALRTDANQK